MLAYIYLERTGDSAFISKRMEDYNKRNDQELIEIYNQACKLGFVGVHAQACSYIALARVFKLRFGSHPFKITDTVIIEFSGPIKATETGWENVT